MRGTPVDSTGTSEANTHTISEIPKIHAELANPRTLHRQTDTELKLESKSRSISKHQKTDFHRAAEYLIETLIFGSSTIAYEKQDSIMKVGRGSYGCVFRIGLEYVIKIPRNDDTGPIPDIEQEIESLNHEIDILQGIKKLQHINIVNYLYSGKYQNIPFIVLTYLKDYTTLYRAVKIDAQYNTENIYRQINSAVDAIHNAGYVHYDLNVGNIMYNVQTGHVCIIDFGLACHADCKGFKRPELYDNPAFPPYHGKGSMSTKQGKTADMYFIAIALVYMLTRGKIDHYRENPKYTRKEYLNEANAFLDALPIDNGYDWKHIVESRILASYDSTGF